MSATGPPIGWNLDNPGSGSGRGSKKKSKEKKKRKEKRTSSSSSSSSSSDSSSDERHKKGNKFSKLRDGKVSTKSKKHKKEKKHKKKTRDRSSSPDFGVPLNLMQSRVHAPETQESWQARQSVLRRVVDPSTGRERLIRGDGEVVEEMVSRDRHRDINRQATAGDGEFFQTNTVGWNVPK